MMVVLTAAVYAPTNALALDSNSMLYLQMKLEDRGYDPGNPDGRMGPNTRAAISAYAQDRNIEANAGQVFLDMRVRNREARRPEALSEEEMRTLENTVADKLKDPGSATFHEEFYIIDETICGRVNGKNVYGGYVGYRYFYAMPFGKDPMHFMVLTIDNEPEGTGWFDCNMTF